MDLFGFTPDVDDVIPNNGFDPDYCKSVFGGQRAVHILIAFVLSKNYLVAEMPEGWPFDAIIYQPVPSKFCRVQVKNTNYKAGNGYRFGPPGAAQGKPLHGYYSGEREVDFFALVADSIVLFIPRGDLSSIHVKHQISRMQFNKQSQDMSWDRLVKWLGA